MKIDIDKIKVIVAKKHKERTKKERDLLSKWRRECTPEERESLNKWQMENLTEEEKAQIIKLVEPLGKMIEEAYQKLGIDKLPPEERSSAFLKYVKAAEEEDAKLILSDQTPGSFKVAEHFFNAFLLKGTTRASEIDNLDPSIKRAIQIDKQKPETVIEGIQATKPEYDLILTLAKLKDENFEGIIKRNSVKALEQESKAYLGAGSTRQIRPAQLIVITPHELARENKGGKEPSGKDIENTSKHLATLAAKKQLIRIKQREYTGKKYYKGKDGKYKQNKTPEYTDHQIQFYEELYKVATYTSESSTGVKREAYLIQYSPLFDEQIDNYFIPVPNDIRKRNIEAGSRNLVFVKLQAYFLRQLKYNFVKDEILIENLINIVAPEKRIDKAEKDTLEALEICKESGLLKSYSIEENKKKKAKLFFEIDKNWL